jgi:hypothetical protein
LKKNKKFYFISSLPRAGVTLLSSLINQTNQLKISPNSILPTLLQSFFKSKNDLVFKNFPNHKALDRCAKNLFDEYYSNINSPNILDRSAWGRADYLPMLQHLFKERKFVLLIRPIIECLASFIKTEKPINVEARCNELLSNNGILYKNICSIKNIIDNNEKYIIIEYNNLVFNPQNEINRLFSFLNLEQEVVNTHNFNQFEFDGVRYNDDVLPANIHTIRTNKVEKIDYDVYRYIPQTIINKIKNLKL